ncbi:phosphoprotein [Trichinella pseudospiralis]|uniref:Uncharacterized protein n=1 Tax=Trichinella pseudospiralis TaxID=6337 RepID=A0A0V0Y503_TRIPS|nr:hypothetical protein T4E_2541 [Trichinella pseudospiralis]
MKTFCIILLIINTAVEICAFSLLAGQQETYYFPTEPWYVPGINSPPLWRLYGMPPPNQWPTREHERFHKYYIDRIFPPMFWNYAWINWMPRTKGWWVNNRRLQLQAFPWIVNQ